MNHKRGHESMEHRQAKIQIRQTLLDAGFDVVLCERACCDLVAMLRVRNGLYVLGVEFERSSRNALRNIHRDLDRKCNEVLVVCSDAALASSINAKVASHLSATRRKKVSIVTQSNLTTEILKGVVKKAKGETK